MPTRILDLDATARLARKPSRATTLDHLWVYNPAATAVYLNVWDMIAVDDDTPTVVIADAVDQIPIAAGFCGLVYAGLGAARAIAISASTGTDGTGAPSAALGVSIRWA